MTYDHKSHASTVSMLLCFGFAWLTTGCGSTAIITRSSTTRPTEGKIIRSDREMLHVQSVRSGDELEIAHRDVVDIDHPGNVAATIGGVLMAYGVANIYVGADKCDTRGPAYCTGVLLPAAIGGSLMAYGLAVWARSVIAAVPTNAPPNASRVTVVPIASMDKTNQFYGASARVSF